MPMPMHRGSGCASTRMSRPWPRQTLALPPRSRTDQWRSTTWSCLPQVCRVSCPLLCRSSPLCVVYLVPSVHVWHMRGVGSCASSWSVVHPASAVWCFLPRACLVVASRTRGCQVAPCSSLPRCVGMAPFLSRSFGSAQCGCGMDGAGRKARTSTLNCDKAGVKLDKNGAVVVDEGLKTSVDNIYAVGDVIDVRPPWRRLRPRLAGLASVPALLPWHPCLELNCQSERGCLCFPLGFLACWLGRACCAGKC